MGGFIPLFTNSWERDEATRGETVSLKGEEEAKGAAQSSKVTGFAWRETAESRRTPPERRKPMTTNAKNRWGRASSASGEETRHRQVRKIPDGVEAGFV